MAVVGQVVPEGVQSKEGFHAYEEQLKDFCIILKLTKMATYFRF